MACQYAAFLQGTWPPVPIWFNQPDARITELQNEVMEQKARIQHLEDTLTRLEQRQSSITIPLLPQRKPHIVIEDED